MKDLTPQEKIDLIDLVRYAYENRYIKWHCEMRMDDPVRKVMQRILAKMFKGATVTKNRNAGAYNISFIPERKFHGDRPDYVGPDNLNPGEVHNMISGIVQLIEHVPREFWPYLLAGARKGWLPRHTHYYYGSRANNPLEQPVPEIDIQRAREDIESVDIIAELGEIQKLAGDFLESYRVQEINLEGNEGRYYHRRHSYINRVLKLQEYGFSLYYQILQDFDAYGMNISKRRAVTRPLIRRFDKEGDLITRLESLATAFTKFKKLRMGYSKHKKLIRAWSHVEPWMTYNWSRRDTIAGLSEEEQQYNKKTIITMALNDFFHTKFPHDPISSPNDMKTAEEEDLEAVVIPSDSIAVGGNVYRREDVQRRFNELIAEERNNGEDT